MPFLLDGGKKIEGIQGIEAYIESLEAFQAGWYEDRCDKYDFDPYAQNFYFKNE